MSSLPLWTSSSVYVENEHTLHFGDRIGLPLQVFYSLRTVVPNDYIHSD